MGDVLLVVGWWSLVFVGYWMGDKSAEFVKPFVAVMWSRWLLWMFPNEKQEKVVHKCLESPLGEVFQDSACDLFLCGFSISFSVGLFLGLTSLVLQVEINSWVASALILSASSSLYLVVNLMNNVGPIVLHSGLDFLVAAYLMVSGFCWGLFMVNCSWFLLSNFGNR